MSGIISKPFRDYFIILVTVQIVGLIFFGLWLSTDPSKSSIVVFALILALILAFIWPIILGLIIERVKIREEDRAGKVGETYYLKTG